MSYTSLHLTEVEFNALCDRINDVVFNNDEAIFEKSMFRLTNGNHEFSFALTRNVCLRHGFDIDYYAFDMAVADLTGGLEVEWVSLDAPKSKRYTNLKEQNVELAQYLGV